MLVSSVKANLLKTMYSPADLPSCQRRCRVLPSWSLEAEVGLKSTITTRLTPDRTHWIPPVFADWGADLLLLHQKKKKSVSERGSFLSNENISIPAKQAPLPAKREIITVIACWCCRPCCCCWYGSRRRRCWNSSPMNRECQSFIDFWRSAPLIWYDHDDGNLVNALLLVVVERADDHDPDGDHCQSFPFPILGLVDSDDSPSCLCDLPWKSFCRLQAAFLLPSWMMKFRLPRVPLSDPIRAQGCWRPSCHQIMPEWCAVSVVTMLITQCDIPDCFALRGGFEVAFSLASPLVSVMRSMDLQVSQIYHFPSLCLHEWRQFDTIGGSMGHRPPPFSAQ